ncbi:DUF2182 domain-containing protein [Paraburkholderia sp. BL21I4N1]|uniref:DUF2182 domain-containing protein n=1 Tax=Paraburkholderia sp. BL21I4N1 TaxID=1938801 RepID=UPI0021575523|nr:DUF2182 domain-containing protein [Paraburkholderia sp. BL21I4N1]
MDRDRTFFAVAAALFVASVTATIVMCASMSAVAMGAMPMSLSMPMPGGWAMSAAWRPICGQTWAGVATSFIGMWTVMTMAMMLPSLVPMLWHYRRSLTNAPARSRGVSTTRRDGLTALAGVAYFVVWIALGGVVFVAGAVLTALEVRFAAFSRGVPFAAGMVVLAAGAWQFSRWKTRRLAGCRRASACATLAPVSSTPSTPSAPWIASLLSADARSAWRHGVRLGLHCCDCCAGFTAILLVSGVMDLRVMAAVTLAISAERLLPRGDRIARASGALAVGLGLITVAQAAGLA